MLFTNDVQYLGVLFLFDNKWDKNAWDNLRELNLKIWFFETRHLWTDPKSKSSQNILIVSQQLSTHREKKSNKIQSHFIQFNKNKTANFLFFLEYPYKRRKNTKRTKEESNRSLFQLYQNKFNLPQLNVSCRLSIFFAHVHRKIYCVE